MSNAAPRRGRPPTIDREVVLDTAIGLLDAEGVQALTMRRLASELGVSAMTPYRHVGSKDELLIVLVVGLAGRHEAGLAYQARPREPKAAVRVVAAAIYDSLAEAPGVLGVLAGRRILEQSLLRAIEAVQAAVHGGGRTIGSAVRAYRLK